MVVCRLGSVLESFRSWRLIGVFVPYRSRSVWPQSESMGRDDDNHDLQTGLDPPEMTLAEGEAQLDQREVNVAEGEARLAQREELYLQREQAVARRELAADERERLADEREGAADEREKIADQREHAADEREKLADQRERTTDEREARLDALERELHERARKAGLPVATIEEAVREAIRRGHALLARSAASLDRSEAALDRASTRNHRQQRKIQREMAASERLLNRAMAPPTKNPDSTSTTGQLDALRQQLVDTARTLAAAEDESARVHEDIAAHRPDKAVESRHVAEQARAGAQRAREIADNYSPP